MESWKEVYCAFFKFSTLHMSKFNSGFLQRGRMENGNHNMTALRGVTRARLNFEVDRSGSTTRSDLSNPNFDGYGNAQHESTA